MSSTAPTSGRHTRITGIADLDKVVHVDQAPIGRTPRSNGPGRRPPRVHLGADRTALTAGESVRFGSTDSVDPDGGP